jgi:CRISPR-associated protein Csx14
MAEAAIPVDFFNPGQVFACLGFIEAADVLLGGAEGVFDWSDASASLFRIRANGDMSPIKAVLEFIHRAEAKAIAPEGSASLAAWRGSWGPDPMQINRGLGYPFPDPSTPAILVCLLGDGKNVLSLDHWGDATDRDNVKFWAGAGGYPGASLARDALELVRGRVADAVDNPFALSAPQSSSFRLDWRRDYIPIDTGFSLNAHGDIDTLGFPLVELLAALGLSYARPKRSDRRNKLEYEYAVVGRATPAESFWLPPPLLRASLGVAAFSFPMRHFRMLLNWPGQEGQARSITTVTEESMA